MSDVRVRVARTEDDVRAALALRHEVFVVEQGVPEELEVDEHDRLATHLLAERDGELVATLRLVLESAARRRGTAAVRLREAERWARERDARAVVLSAQTYAVALYAAAGYEARGDVYLDAGIEHVTMELPLA
jgi:predicted GNAT family N-acyltransferase